MKLAIRINNHGWELSFRHTHIELKEILAKHNAEPHDILLPIIDQVYQYKPNGNEDTVKAVCRCLELEEKGHDPACRLYTNPHEHGAVPINVSAIAEIIYTTPESIQPNYTCPCLEGILATTCEECADAGDHSGGCLTQGCVKGKIQTFVPCYCIRPGYVPCFECSIATQHSAQCMNCDGR